MPRYRSERYQRSLSMINDIISYYGVYWLLYHLESVIDAYSVLLLYVDACVSCGLSFLLSCFDDLLISSRSCTNATVRKTAESCHSTPAWTIECRDLTLWHGLRLATVMGPCRLSRVPSSTTREVDLISPVCTHEARDWSPLHPTEQRPWLCCSDYSCWRRSRDDDE
jgi:hypothetical protein